MWWINTPEFRVDVSALQAGTTRKRISRKNLATIEFPVPPLNEQRRIVAAIEEQFSRLDALEKTIETMVGPFERGKGRVGALRRSILIRAFSGQLVPQDPNDEPASALLARISAERAAAVPARSIRRKAS